MGNPFTSLMSNLAFVCLCLSVLPWSLSKADEKQCAMHLEGETSIRTIRPDGSVADYKPQKFSLWISGCRWAVHLYGDTNMPNGITQVTSDATNIYVLVPDASGETKVGDQMMPFLQLGDVYPGTLKVFPFRMGPIWWAYCSRCVTGEKGGDSQIPDFMNFTGRGMESRLNLSMKAISATKMGTLVGPIEQSLFLTNDTGQNSWMLASLKPLALIETNGVSLVTTCSVVKYIHTIASTLQPYEETILRISEFNSDASDSHFVPAISSSALIRDRRQPFSGEYLATNWLSSDERRRAIRSSVLVDGTSKSSSQMPRHMFRAILVIVTVLPLLIFGLFRLGQAKLIAKQHKQHKGIQ